MNDIHTFLKILSFLNNFQLFLVVLNSIEQQNYPTRIIINYQLSILNQEEDKPYGINFFKTERSKYHILILQNLYLMKF